jgi:hypothetical protein
MCFLCAHRFAHTKMSPPLHLTIQICSPPFFLSLTSNGQEHLDHPLILPPTHAPHAHRPLPAQARTHGSSSSTHEAIFYLLQSTHEVVFLSLVPCLPSTFVVKNKASK